jgi:hypothetical protein
MQSFLGGVAEEVMYPGDWVALSTTSPATQGPNGDGWFEGRLLDSLEDWIYVSKAVTSQSEGFQVGCVYGLSESQSPPNTGDVSALAIPAHSVVSIMYMGVHPFAWADSSTSAGDKIEMGAVAGQAATGAMDASSNELFMGTSLSSGSTYTRVTADDSEQIVAFVRCGG